MKRLRDLTAVLGMVALTACNNASIEGSWVEPVPGMPGMQQGFVLDGDGSASSINMATLKYEAWKKVGNRLLLSGTSIGNHQNISFTDTLTALDNEGITHFGYDDTAVMDIKGVKVGLVGIYELNDHLGREQQLKDNIAKVKADGAELVIVIFHWGNETETVPDTNQMTLGRLAIDEGADLVCGHHPHVLQGIETYKGKNIVYSLGNFCFGGNSSPSDMDTMIFQQTFTITSNGVQADNVTNIIPCSISSADGYNNYQPTPATGDEATRIKAKIDERSAAIPSADSTAKSSGDTGSSDTVSADEASGNTDTSDESDTSSDFSDESDSSDYDASDEEDYSSDEEADFSDNSEE